MNLAWIASIGGSTFSAGWLSCAAAFSVCSRYQSVLMSVPMSVSVSGVEPSSSQATSFVAAGPFGYWLSQARASLLGDGGAEVPCGDCRGCCISSYFIPLRPQDAAAAALVPEEFLVNAPGLAPGHTMMGYLPDGSCPMLAAGNCSIYRQRPQTCRDYDCRIFAAAGIEAGSGKSVINQRIREWRFSYPTQQDRQAHGAVLAAAAFIQEKKSCFPGGRAPTAPTGIAVLAIKTYAVFLEADVQTKSDVEIAAAIIAASRQFDTGSLA